MRRAAKIDANHVAVVAALRACGAKVLSLAPIGKGCPDLLVLFRGRLALLEVKDGAKPIYHRKLKPAQVEFHQEWPVTVVLDPEHAVKAMTGGTTAA